jgi:hypothetical protein
MALSLNDKILYTLYTAAVFFIVSSPQMYRLVEGLLGGFVNVANNGCPTCSGLIIHTLVFILLIFGLMELTAYIKEKDGKKEE